MQMAGSLTSRKQVHLSARLQFQAYKLGTMLTGVLQYLGALLWPLS